ncbi:MAG: DNA polymerase III subunit beta [Dehalococcoidia bacterium]
MVIGVYCAHVNKVTPSNGSASESQTARKGIRLVCGANTSYIPDEAWLTEKNRFDGHCRIRVSRHNIVIPNLGGLELAEALVRVIPFAEKGNGRPILRCIKFMQRDGKLSLITCDGFRLAIMALDFEDSDNDVLVDASELRSIVLALKKAQRVRLSFKENGEKDDRYLIIDTEAISYRFKAQVGDYPDYEGIMPSEFVSLSALWLDRECPIKLSLSEGKVTLQAKEDRGEAVIQADTTGQAEIAVNASFLLQGLRAMGGMTELSIKDAVSSMLFSADDFQLLITPMVWTEHKPVVAAEKGEGKQTAPKKPADKGIATEPGKQRANPAQDVVAEAEAVISKAAKKVKSASTQKTKDKPESRRDKVKAGKA